MPEAFKRKNIGKSGCGVNKRTTAPSYWLTASWICWRALFHQELLKDILPQRQLMAVQFSEKQFLNLYTEKCLTRNSQVLDRALSLGSVPLKEIDSVKCVFLNSSLFCFVLFNRCLSCSVFFVPLQRSQHSKEYLIPAPLSPFSVLQSVINYHLLCKLRQTS